MAIQQPDIDRSRLTTYVDDPNQKYLFHYGDGFLYDRLPKGTRVIYPPPPLDPIANPDELIDFDVCDGGEVEGRKTDQKYCEIDNLCRTLVCRE